MLREAVALPRNREGATRTLAIGGALVVLSPLVLPAVVLVGYLLRVLDAGARGRSAPPTFEAPGRLFVDGLAGTAVGLVYGAISLLAAAVGPALALAFVLPAGELGGATRIELAIAGFAGIVTPLGALVVLVHLPAALTALATQGRLRAGFQLRALWTVVPTGAYLLGVLGALALWIVGTALASALLPVLVGFGALFYVHVAAAALLGRAFGAGARAAAGSEA